MMFNLVFVGLLLAVADGQSESAQAEPIGPYSFGYIATSPDGKSSREEISDGSGTVKGFYEIAGVDGINRLVHYLADANGFRATISTNEPGTESKSPANVFFDSSQPTAESLSQKFGSKPLPSSHVRDFGHSHSSHHTHDDDHHFDGHHHQPDGHSHDGFHDDKLHGDRFHGDKHHGDKFHDDKLHGDKFHEDKHQGDKFHDKDQKFDHKLHEHKTQNQKFDHPKDHLKDGFLDKKEFVAHPQFQSAHKSDEATVNRRPAFSYAYVPVQFRLIKPVLRPAFGFGQAVQQPAYVQHFVPSQQKVFTQQQPFEQTANGFFVQTPGLVHHHQQYPLPLQPVPVQPLLEGKTNLANQQPLLEQHPIKGGFLEPVKGHFEQAKGHFEQVKGHLEPTKTLEPTKGLAKGQTKLRSPFKTHHLLQTSTHAPLLITTHHHSFQVQHHQPIAQHKHVEQKFEQQKFIEQPKFIEQHKLLEQHKLIEQQPLHQLQEPEHLAQEKLHQQFEQTKH